MVRQNHSEKNYFEINHQTCLGVFIVVNPPLSSPQVTRGTHLGVMD